MKKFIALSGLVLITSFASLSCDKKVSDAELQSQATTVVTANPNASVEVQDGVAHLKGSFMDETSKVQTIASLKSIDGINEVMDMTETVAAPEAAGIDPAKMEKVISALSDFPSTKAEVINGQITITGDVSETQSRKITESMDALNIGKYNNNLVVK